ncbi:hypothetical protein ACQ4LE_001654 [Meloidogyne hapla]|uniref:DUF148 domain-containing protein n=1 Tax=Meloidogyne hapla TaxID=6305 RepID=A0A1I8BXK1_MELHA
MLLFEEHKCVRFRGDGRGGAGGSGRGDGGRGRVGEGRREGGRGRGAGGRGKGRAGGSGNGGPGGIGSLEGNELQGMLNLQNIKYETQQSLQILNANIQTIGSYLQDINKQILQITQDTFFTPTPLFLQKLTQENIAIQAMGRRLAQIHLELFQSHQHGIYQHQNEAGPSNQTPSSQPPSIQLPLNQPPSSQHPLNQPPSYQTPLNQPPSYQTPLNQPPSYQPLSNQLPSYHPPLNQPPSNQAPSNQRPSNQPPSNQPPLNQSPYQHQAVQSQHVEGGHSNQATDAEHSWIQTLLNNYEEKLLLINQYAQIHDNVKEIPVFISDNNKIIRALDQAIGNNKRFKEHLQVIYSDNVDLMRLSKLAIGKEEKMDELQQHLLHSLELFKRIKPFLSNEHHNQHGQVQDIQTHQNLADQSSSEADSSTHLQYGASASYHPHGAVQAHQNYYGPVPYQQHNYGTGPSDALPIDPTKALEAELKRKRKF